MAIFKGQVKANIIDVRFAIAGKVSSVAKKTGDVVKKWGLVASLDRKILQTELDSQLADYEKARADFEIFNQKNPDPQEAVDKYLKTEKQAVLNASVKDVELAKAKLDQADLFSPVDGIILDDNSIVPGIYVTPAGSLVRIIDTSSFYFEIGTDQKDIELFKEEKTVKVKIEGFTPNEIEGKISPVFSDGKSFFVKIPLNNIQGLLLGMNGEIKI